MRLIAFASLLPFGVALAGGFPPLPAVTNAAWEARCASCHILYHPGLLPERSWRRLMDTQKSHFGPNLGLDASTVQAITGFLAAHAADRVAHPLSAAVSASVSSWERPRRITDTDWFRNTHASLPKVGHIANCSVCHADFAAGDFAVRH